LTLPGLKWDAVAAVRMAWLCLPLRRRDIDGIFSARWPREAEMPVLGSSGHAMAHQLLRCVP
jgi:hypothetical protein